MEQQAKADSIHYKQFLLLVQQPHIPLSDLQKIKSDVLIMAGDRDAIRVTYYGDCQKYSRGFIMYFTGHDPFCLCRPATVV